jgi:hypothetical protein
MVPVEVAVAAVVMAPVQVERVETALPMAVGVERVDTTVAQVQPGATVRKVSLSYRTTALYCRAAARRG